MNYFVYILKSQNFAKTYTGSTDNVERRFMQHNLGCGAFTSKYKPWLLIHTESFASRDEALLREKYLKTKTGRKFIKSVLST